MMKVCKVGTSLKDLIHPVVYLGGTTYCNLWEEKASKYLREKVERGTLLVSTREDNDKVSMEEYAEWNFYAIENSRVVSFWFPIPTIDASVSLELGRVLGRYCLGGGPQKVIVSFETGLQGTHLVKEKINILDKYLLKGEWKIRMEQRSLIEHCDLIIKSLSK